MRIGTIGDLHAPFIHPMYRRFCLDTFAAWRIEHVHFAGDIVDAHALSFWEHNPNGRSAEDESQQAAEDVRRWRRSFETASVSIGNHDERQFRLARKHGLPDRFLRSYADVWQTPDWDWRTTHKFDGVLYEHGTGTTGKDAALNRAMQKRCSVVIGHVHSWAGVKWHANEFNTIFGLNAGCGIDCRQYAFDYGKAFPIRPVLGCGIVIDGEQAHFIPMPCGRRDKYHRSRARRKKGKT